MSRHPLCTGAGCSSCARIAANEKRIRDELRDRVARVAASDDGASHSDNVIGWLVEHFPDLLTDALDANGAPS